MGAILSILTFAVLIASPSSASAPSPAPSTAPMGLALYSDVCLNEQSGDLRGERIGVLRLNRGYDLYVFYQDAGGASFTLPAIVRLDPFQGETVGPTIFFTIDYNGPDTFRGTITDKMIIGEFSDPRHSSEFGRRQFRLHRVSLDQKGYPDC